MDTAERGYRIDWQHVQGEVLAALKMAAVVRELSGREPTAREFGVWVDQGGNVFAAPSSAVEAYCRCKRALLVNGASLVAFWRAFDAGAYPARVSVEDAARVWTEEHAEREIKRARAEVGLDQ